MNIVEAEVCKDHVHMLLEIPPKISISGFMGFLKGKMRYQYRGRNFWCRGYYVDTAGKNMKRIQEYIKNQLKEDKEAEQLSLDLSDPFSKK